MVASVAMPVGAITPARPRFGNRDREKFSKEGVGIYVSPPVSGKRPSHPPSACELGLASEMRLAVSKAP